MPSSFLGETPLGQQQLRTAASSSTSRGSPGPKPRVNVVWHKMSDLRLHDHEALARAHLDSALAVPTENDGISMVEIIFFEEHICLWFYGSFVFLRILWVFDFTQVVILSMIAQGLPVIHLHVLEKFWFGRTRLGGFRKTGAVRCRFWLESVEDLKASLESRGQQLFLRYGSWAAASLKDVDVMVAVVL